LAFWPLASGLWGSFPSDKGLEYYQRYFSEVFEADQETYTSFDNFLFDTITPLHVTTYKLTGSSRCPSSPCAFIVDEANSLSVIDFWNLRACGGQCIPLPVSRVEEIASDARRFMNAHLRKWASNSTKLDYPTLIRSRGMDKDTVERVVEVLSLNEKHRLLRGYYPRLWDKDGADLDRSNAVSFHYKSNYEHIDVEGDSVAFDALSPEFANDYRWSMARWINVMRTNELFPSGFPANVIPNSLKHVNDLVGVMTRPAMWASREGLNVCCNSKDTRHHWELAGASRIGEQWAADNRYSFTLSDSGQILENMMNITGGLRAGRWFANEHIIRALGDMAKGKLIQAGEFRTIVKNANEAEGFSDRMITNNLEYFQENGILSLCIELQCPHCRRYPWYVLEDLSHEVQCGHCLRHFKFPIARPPTRKWHYRSTGPFASPGLAQGAYSVFLALRFLDGLSRGTTTCVPSCTLGRGGSSMELDFICFRNTASWADRSQHIIFGECKCFGDFEEKDVHRMRRITKSSPGSIAAFCTLKPSLTPAEKKLLKKLAESGRRPRKDIGWPLPVLVLTGKELCVMDPDSFSHQLNMDNSTGLARRMPRGSDNLMYLCSASQEEYLGLPPWHTWIEQYYRRRAKRKK
jgi:hypothetical protein